MIGASITLSVVVTVISFILAVTGSFPLGDVGNGSGDPSDEFSTADVEEAGRRIEASYCAIIEDIASFQKDPDLARAEARKEAFTEFAQGLIGDYKDLSDELQTDLDDLIDEANETYVEDTPQSTE